MHDPKLILFRSNFQNAFKVAVLRPDLALHAYQPLGRLVAMLRDQAKGRTWGSTDRNEPGLAETSESAWTKHDVRALGITIYCGLKVGIFRWGNQIQ